MPLIVEDGTGLTNAESYITVEEFKAYAVAHGLVYTDKTDEQIESALRRGTAYIDGKYMAQNSCGRWESMFSGQKLRGRAQALQWPRSGAIDSDGQQIPSNEVPRELKSATAEGTLRELTTPGSLSPDYVAAEAIKRQKVDVLEIEYQATATADGGVPTRPVLTVVDELVAPLLRSNRLCGVAVFVV